jgi:catechol 2,3-dioxygenase
MSTAQRTSQTDVSALIERVARVDLRVRSVERALDFYRDIVGLLVLEQDETHASLGPTNGSAILFLTSDGVDTPADPGATGLYHTAFLYPDRPALGDALARLAEAGYRIGAGDHGVSEALYIDDPDGNGVELYRDRPREEWPEPGPGERIRMYTAPVDLEGVLAEARTQGSAPAPEGTKVGHVHLQVANIERTAQFYVEGLGLDLMASLGSAVFMSSRGYHHHLGANVWNSRGSSPAPRNRAGLDRIVLAVENIGDLEEARTRLSQAGHEAGGSENELIVRDPDDIELRFVVER